MTESDIQRKIMKTVSKHGVRVFRNNVGMGWTGKLISNKQGRVTLDHARPVKFGLVQGASDLIGITPTVITDDMVGKTMGIFTALEIKTDKGRATPEQEQFIYFVIGAGGIAGIARNEDDAVILINQFVSE